MLSNWSLENNNVTERIAQGLALQGRKVLYCRNPLSYFKHGGSTVKSISKNLFAFDTRFFGARLSSMPWFSGFQQQQLAHSMFKAAKKLGFQNPAFVYHDVSPLGGRELLRAFKNHGCSLIHINLDYTDKPLNAELADQVYSIPEASFQRLTQSFGSKVRRLPQLGPVDYEDSAVVSEPVADSIKQIPKPWLLYLGSPSSRLDFQMVRAVLERNRRWSFLFCGPSPLLNLPNCYSLPWMRSPQMHGLLQNVDVGLLPYNCADEMQYHCVPLKLFDYFLHRIPVIITPIRYTAELSGLIYTADTVEAMERAIELALKEAPEDQVRAQRQTIARQHNLFSISESILI